MIGRIAAMAGLRGTGRRSVSAPKRNDACFAFVSDLLHREVRPSFDGAPAVGFLSPTDDRLAGVLARRLAEFAATELGARTLWVEVAESDSTCVGIPLVARPRDHDRDRAEEPPMSDRSSPRERADGGNETPNPDRGAAGPRSPRDYPTRTFGLTYARFLRKHPLHRATSHGCCKDTTDPADWLSDARLRVDLALVSFSRPRDDGFSLWFAGLDGVALVLGGPVAEERSVRNACRWIELGHGLLMGAIWAPSTGLFPKPR